MQINQHFRGHVTRWPFTGLGTTVALAMLTVVVGVPLTLLVANHYGWWQP